MSKNLFGISDALINDVKSVLGEKLTGGQKNLDVDKDGKIEASDFKKLRNKKLAAKMKKHEAGETAAQEKKEHSGPCSADCDCMKEEVELGEGDPIVRTKAFPGKAPEGTYADMRAKGTLPKPVQAKDEEDTPPWSGPSKKVPVGTVPSKSHRQKLARSGIPMKEDAIEEAKQYIEVIDASGQKKKVAVEAGKAFAALTHYRKQPNTKSARIVSEEAESISEVLTKATSSADIIHDFVHSKDPRFAGKSKAERTKMALGAYYGMHPELKKEEVELDEARGRPKTVKPGEEAADSEGDDTGSIVMKLRKASSIGKPVQFKDSSTHNISKSDARKALAKHDALRTSIEKEKLANRMHASHASFKDVLAGKDEPEEMTLMQKIKAARAARQ